MLCIKHPVSFLFLLTLPRWNDVPEASPQHWNIQVYLKATIILNWCWCTMAVVQCFIPNKPVFQVVIFLKNLHLLETQFFSASLLQSVTVSGSVLQSVTVSGSWVVVRAVCGSLLQSLAIMTICGNQWQSVAVNWQSLLICISLSAAGAKANCALPRSYVSLL